MNLKKLIKNNDARIYLALFLMCFILSLLFRPENKVVNNIENLPEISTFIPNGFSLITSNIKNIDKIKSLIGQQGVVDLFHVLSKKRVAKNIRIIKAPHAEDYGILCPTKLCPELLKYSDVYAVVKNPSAQNTVISSTPRKTKRKLIFYEEEP